MESRGSALRLVAAVGLAMLLVAGTALAATAWWWSRDGWIRLEVDEGAAGDRVSLSAPAWLLRLGPRWPEDAWDPQVRSRLVPPLRRALREWGSIPDGVVVRVREDGCELTVGKRGAAAVLVVRDGPATVRMEIPARALRRALPRA
jgi:hypothetical protein